MRHRKKVKKLGRTASHRRAVLANLAVAIIDKERIRTTDALARESKRLVEKLITKAKTGTLHARRQVLSVIKDKKIVAKLFDTIAPRYADRHGGYVRLIRVGNRPGDGAALSIVELIGSELTVEEPKKTKKKRKKSEETEEVPPLAPSPEEEEIEAEVEAKAGEEAEAKTEKKVEAKAEAGKEKKSKAKTKTKAEKEEKKSEKERTSPEEGSETGSESTAPEKEGGKTEGRG